MSDQFIVALSTVDSNLHRSAWVYRPSGGECIDINTICLLHIDVMYRPFQQYGHCLNIPFHSQTTSVMFLSHQTILWNVHTNDCVYTVIGSNRNPVEAALMLETVYTTFVFSTNLYDNALQQDVLQHIVAVSSTQTHRLLCSRYY